MRYRRGGDEKIVRAPWSAAPSGVSEKSGVGSRDLQVVRLDGDARQERVDKGLA
jgi:hypothetical protein